MWNQVQKILNDRSMSIYRLARKSNIHENTLYSYSRGEAQPSFENACKIADALGVPLDSLRKRNGGSNG